MSWREAVGDLAWRAFDPGRLAALGVLVVCLGLRLWDPAPLEFLRLRTFDLFQAANPRLADDPPVVIVDIDERSLAAYGQWPWPRAILARPVRNLVALDARVIGFDMVFSEPDRASPQ